MQRSWRKCMILLSLGALPLAALLGCAGPAPTAGTPGATAPPTQVGAASPAVGATSTTAPTATVVPTATTSPSPVASPTTAATATPAGTTTAVGSVGQRIESTGMALTVLDVFTTGEITILTPEPGHTFMVVQVNVEDVSRDRGFFNTLDFEARDSQGNTFTAEFVAPEPQLGSGELVPGEKAHGNVAFEVPNAASGFVLLWQPSFLSAPVRVNLGR